MAIHGFTRREVLKTAPAGAIGFTDALLLRPIAAGAAGAAAYDPAAHFDLVVSEVELRRNSASRMLMARVYQPKGQGPFPAVLDLHGGAWNSKKRLAEEPMDRALATSGLLVVAVDMTLAPEAPYPACVEDVTTPCAGSRRMPRPGTARPRNSASTARRAAAMSPNSLVMRPGDLRYNAIPLAAAPEVDATLAYAAMRSPISNTFARYENAVRRGNEDMVKFNKTFFDPWETIHEANPQEILDRGEKITLVPFLIMQGALDDNVLPEVQEKFVRAYRAAGVRVPPLRELGARMGRQRGAANRKGAPDGQGVYRAPAQGLSAAEQTAGLP